MRNYAKVGGREGRPGYRIPDYFIGVKRHQVMKEKSSSRYRETWLPHSQKESWR